MSSKLLNQTDSIGWVDFMRIVACFLVVLAHCCDPFVARFNNNLGEFYSGVAWGSFVRPCVPLFVMISGVLLLPLRQEMGAFYQRRLKRIIIPLIVWSLILPVMYYFHLSGTKTLSPNIDMTNYTLEATGAKMYQFLFNFNYDTTPLWYLYMLVGIYLFIPIIAPWIANAKKSDFHKFLIIWAISMVIPYVKMFAPDLGYTGNYGNMGILGECDWNPYGSFYYFSGFIGYIIFAFYLVKFPLDWSWKKTLAITLPTFLVGYGITSGAFILIQKAVVDDYSKLEIPWYFSGINVFMMTASAFIILQKLPVPSLPILRKIANLTFGVYLIHFVVVQWVYDLLYKVVDIPAALFIPMIAVLVFAVTAFITWLLSLSKYTRWTVM